MNTNTKMSKGLEYESGKDLPNSIYVAGAPWGCSGAKNGIGIAAAFDSYHKNHPDFFFVTWLVKKQRSNPPVDWACRILFQVGSPNHEVNEHLKDIKLEVIDTLQNSNVSRILSGKGYRVNSGTRTSLDNIRGNKNTALFTVVLDASHSKDTSTTDIKAKHQVTPRRGRRAVGSSAGKVTVTQKAGKLLWLVMAASARAST
jgi:hypothetical protein